jgi:hypothetical protein
MRGETCRPSRKEVVSTNRPKQKPKCLGKLSQNYRIPIKKFVQWFTSFYRGADKSFARPDWKNNWKIAIFRPTRRSLLPRRPGWTDNLLKFLFSSLQKLEFSRCSLLPSWSGLGLISTPVHTYGQTGEESDGNSCYEGWPPHLKTDAWITANVAPTPTQTKESYHL